MKRTELLALAERLKPMAEAPCFDGLDMASVDDCLRQIAEAQPVAWGATDGSGWCIANRRMEANPQEREAFSIPLFRLPLED